MILQSFQILSTIPKNSGLSPVQQQNPQNGTGTNTKTKSILSDCSQKLFELKQNFGQKENEIDDDISAYKNFVSKIDIIK